MPPRALTKAQKAQVDNLLTWVDRHPITGRRRCVHCGVDAPEASQNDSDDFLCDPTRGCARWQQARAYPDGVPGYTQEPETCRYCGHESEWAPGEEPGMKRCPACRSDMHPEEALKLHGQAIVPFRKAGPGLRRMGAAAASGEMSVDHGWRVVYDQGALARSLEEISGG
jgi:hypothetical protein